MRNLTKNKINLVILGFIFVFSILASFNFNYNQGKNYGNLEGDTTDNNFQENKILKSSNGGINLITPEDKVYYKPMSGYYPGTNSFDHDEVETEPTWFQEVGTNGGTVQIIDELDGHNTVLELHDTSETANAHVKRDIGAFPLPQSGSIEFWMRTDNASKLCGFTLHGGQILPEARLIWVQILNGNIQYQNGTDWVIIGTIENNKWLHVRIDFECSGGGYQELPQYYWQMFINGGLALFKDTFLNDRDQITKIDWYTDFLLGYSDYYYYIDAIAFSWIDGCNIADNMNDGLLLKCQGPSNLTWAGYSLDGHNNITILGNTAIPKPGNGVHSIQVFGVDSEGIVYSSELRNFEVNNPTLVLIPGVGGDSAALLNGIKNSTLDLNGNGISDFIDYYGSQNIFNVSYYDKHTPRPEFDGILGAWNTSIKIIGNAVKNYIINEFNAGHIKKNIDLIGWSMGGLVIRSMIKEHYNDLRKAGITIIHTGIFGTPHHGQWMANSAYWMMENDGTLTPELNQTCYLQMYTFSEFLMDLNFGDETPYDIYYNTYRGTGKKDLGFFFGLLLWVPGYGWFVIPAVFGNGNYDPILVNQIINIIGVFGDSLVTSGSAVLSGAVNNRAYWKVGHSGIVNKPEVRKDILWDLKHYPEVEIDVESPMNQSYYELMDGYYPGTNSFDHNNVGYRPDWFDTIDTDGGTIQFIEELDGHNKVLELSDTNNGSDLNAVVKKSMSTAPTFGTVEYWMRSDNISSLCGFRISNSTDQETLMFIRTYDGFLQGRNGPEITNITVLQSNTWYHIRIDFECSGGQYQGLSQHTWCIYVNGVKYGDYSFFNDVTHAGMTVWYTDWQFEQPKYSYYIDAIGLSVDDYYNIGDNLKEGLLLGLRKNFAHEWIKYSLDGQVNITIQGDTTIPMPADGSHTIQMFVKEWSGIIYQSSERHFMVDTTAPISSIDFDPHSGTDMVNISTTFTITADDGIGSGISVIRYKINDSDWNDYSTPFDLSTYDYGYYLISFYAIDLAGHIEEENTRLVNLIEIPPEPSKPSGAPAIPGYNLVVLIGIISVISIITIKSRIKKYL